MFRQYYAYAGRCPQLISDSSITAEAELIQRFRVCFLCVTGQSSLLPRLNPPTNLQKIVEENSLCDLKLPFSPCFLRMRFTISERKTLCQSSFPFCLLDDPSI